jgi:hypothetical protein
METNTNYGWFAPGDNALTAYINAVTSYVNDDQKFSTFRQTLSAAGNVLEGDTSCGSLWLNMILEKYGDTVLKEKLDLFKRNDIYGSPTIMNYGEYGNMCPFTFLYILQGLNAVNNFQTNKFDKIVEIGAGFGSLCIIMDSLCDYKEYVIVDLPEVIELDKKYLGNFPEIYKKVTFVPCTELSDIQDIDLCISIAAISECNTETQLHYFDKIIKHAKYAYLGCNYDVTDLLNACTQIFDTNHMFYGLNEYYLTKK